MFPSEAFTPEWISARRRELGDCDPGILEKCVHALTLLGYLAETELPFLFKGGTSLLLHLPRPRRLSRDIDIVCGRPATEIDPVVARIGQRPPFLRWQEDDRGARGLPRRRHFKLFYRSALPGTTEQEVLLDVVEESREIQSVASLPIRTSFLEPEKVVRVRTPTIESLLGDKLTAFAPNTTGVPLRGPDGQPADVQQVAKQLFDIGVLFDAASDFSAIASTYAGACALESEYRSSRPTQAQVVDDTWRACLALTARQPKILVAYPDARLLHDGLDRLRGHLITPEYVAGRETRAVLAAKVAALVAYLGTGEKFDFRTDRYTGNTDQLQVVKTATLNETEFGWLDRLKQVNPEAYYYWHKAVRVRSDRKL